MTQAKEVDRHPGALRPGDRRRRALRVQWSLVLATPHRHPADQLSAHRPRAEARHQLPLLSQRGEQIDRRRDCPPSSRAWDVTTRSGPIVPRTICTATSRTRARRSRSSTTTRTRRGLRRHGAEGDSDSVDSHPQAARVRALPAHAPRERRRHLPDLSRADAEHGAGLSVLVPQHGLVRQLPRERLRPEGRTRGRGAMRAPGPGVGANAAHDAARSRRVERKKARYDCATCHY